MAVTIEEEKGSDLSIHFQSGLTHSSMLIFRKAKLESNLKGIIFPGQRCVWQNFEFLSNNLKFGNIKYEINKCCLSTKFDFTQSLSTDEKVK